jgi:hypothetical protein
MREKDDPTFQTLADALEQMGSEILESLEKTVLNDCDPETREGKPQPVREKRSSRKD